MIVLIDNYDSFTYNLVQRIGELDPSVVIKVYRNDQVTVDQVEHDSPDHLIISPGPCTPREGGVSNEMIVHFSGKIPVLGVCLGHQCLGFVGGAKIVRAPRIMHGKTSEIHHDGRTIFRGLSNPFTATRYHSLIILRDSIPGEFEITAWTDQDEVMGIRHKHSTVEGVQFHPESFLTIEGPKLLENFLSI